MELKEVIKVLKSKLWLILVVTCLGTSAIGAISVFLLKPVYEASANLILIKSSEEIEGELVDYNTLLANGMLIETYRDIVKTPGFMEKVVKNNPELNITANKLITKVKVNSSNNQIMNVVVRDSSYNVAAQIANAVSSVMVQEIPKIMKINNVSILDNATALTNPLPVKPNHVINIAIGFILSFLFIVSIVFIAEYLNDTIRSETEIEEVLGLAVLGVIPKVKKADVFPLTKSQSEEKVGDRSYVAINQ